MRKIFLWTMITLLLSSCGTKQAEEDRQSDLDKHQSLDTVAEVIKGDFVYRLVSEKSEYENSEDVMVYAELEYIGSKEEIEIYHAASPFYFPMKEATRDYEIGYPMNEPLLTTTLKKEEPLRQEYRRSGGYGSNDDEDYVKFMKTFLEDGFLTGIYVVNGYANFFIENEDKEKIDFIIKGEFDFKVR